MFQRILKYIERYFIRPSQISIEVARIVFGVCSLLIFQVKQLVISGNQVYTGWNISNYYPKGILAIICPEVPSIETIDLWMSLQYLSALFLIFGLFSRASLIVNFFCNLFLISLSESFSIAWSHGYNLNLLAQMPFIFAPVGRLISIDFLIHKYIFKKEIKKSVNAIYVWMANFGIVTIFFNAFFWKIISDRQGISLKWALSDNFRNQLIIRYSYLSEDIPGYLDFIVNSEFWYQFVAFLNLSFQFLPFLSLFFIKKPWIRFLLGFLFVIEEIGLAVVMQLFDWYWIPLFLIFIDWDYFLSFRNINTTSILNNVKSRFILFSYSSYIFIYFSIAFCFYLPFGYYANGGGINSYPFSSYSMYSGLLVKNELGPVRMLGYDMDYSGKDLNIEKNEKDDIVKKTNRKFYGYYTQKDSTEVRNALNYLKEYLKNDFKVKADSIVSKRILYEFTAYPEKAGVKKYLETNIGILNKEQFLYAYPQTNINNDSVFVRPIQTGFNKPFYKLKIYNFTLRKTFDVVSNSMSFSRKFSPFEGGKIMFVLEVHENNEVYLFSGNEENL
jgi:hypothetical protein